jgi:putative flippase GtrA
MGCLWISRSALGLDDPLSDNVSANVIGLALATAARFVLNRQLVFDVRADLSDEGAASRS